jgi:type I site-specific restriction-modification system R (restriction) subunit
MERNQFEKEIQKKFLKREITPSKASWQKLQEILPEATDKPAGKNYLFWLAAAAIVLLFFVFYNPLQRSVNTISTETLPVVESANPEQSSEVIKSESDAQSGVENLVVAEKERKTDTTSKKIKSKQLQIPIITGQSKHVAKNSIQKTPNHSIKSVIQDSLTKENAVATVFSEAKKIEAAEGEITETVIDELIRKARQKLKAQKTAENKNTSEAAMALLESVEEELDKSFKDKVFELLKNGMVKVKTAVAERNQ